MTARDDANDAVQALLQKQSPGNRRSEDLAAAKTLLGRNLLRIARIVRTYGEPANTVDSIRSIATSCSLDDGVRYL